MTLRVFITSRLNWQTTSNTATKLTNQVYNQNLKFRQMAWYNSLWLWRWPPHSNKLFRTTFTRMIILNQERMTSLYLGSTYLWNDSWVQTFHRIDIVTYGNEIHLLCWNHFTWLLNISKWWLIPQKTTTKRKQKTSKKETLENVIFKFSS